MPYLRSNLVFIAILLLSACVSGSEAAPDTADSSSPREIEANSLLYAGLTRWDEETLPKLAKAINSLPEEIACRVLWQVVAAPNRHDAIPVFLAALSSPLLSIRLQAADIMASFDSPDMLDRLLEILQTVDSDGKIIQQVITGMAAKPNRRAVRGLMQLLLFPSLSDQASVAIAQHLRRLTRTNLPDLPEDWKTWWLNNARLYE
ncbi:MAG: hypothetical protein FWG74_00915 [Planctomycetes bacterium]|nr:hypothetical protein [Planctomycetota bacterium]